jgi:formyltetrahydrofolate-dependent phosphoribosylglycinamide formyltransferase
MMRLVVLISGNGSNLQAIIDAIAVGKLEAEIALVVSNRKAAYGLTRAENTGIPTLYFPLKPYTDATRPREEYDAELATKIAPYQPGRIVLAGWMHVFTTAFLDQFPSQVINLHPALPGTFAGAHAIERAFEAWQRGEIMQSGCMVHTVVPELDAGPVIAEEVVPFEPGDTLETYEARMHEVEHGLIVEALRRCAVTPPPETRRLR